MAINMVSTTDGRARVEAGVQHISSELDRALMKRIRASADAVATGAETIRKEQLNLTVPDDVSEGKPLPVIFTGSGDLPHESPVFKEDHPRPLIFTPENSPGELPEGARVYRLGQNTVDLKEALRVLHTEFSIKTLILEGGPSLNHQAISKGLVSELFLTLSPKLAAGENPLTILSGKQFPDEEMPSLQLLSAYLFESQLFLRYSLS